ncbi:MAG TPA: hypothetical protein VMI12_00635 [Puia sp.]|nr:hypothetical protein [Puia sp.]
MFAGQFADAVHTSHAVEFFGLLGGGQRDGGMGWIRPFELIPV